MDIEYSTGGKEELDLVEPLWRRLRAHHAAVSPEFSKQLRSVSFESRKRDLLKNSDDGHLRIDFARERKTGELAGYCVSSVTGDGQGEIDSVFVKEEYRGCGVGDSLMKRALAWMDGFQVKGKRLQVIIGNEKVHRFYARFGFRTRTIIMEQTENAPKMIEKDKIFAL
jgi:diamine N-acetyltransferase